MQRTRKVFALLLAGAVVSVSSGAGLAIAASQEDAVTLSTNVQQTITLGCGADVNLGALTPGNPVTGSTTCTATTNAEAGYDLQVKRNDSDTTMDKISDAAINITDKTAWDPTANSGDGNAATYTGTGLAFRVKASGTTATHNSTWWGTDGAAKYAGFPSAYALAMDHDNYSSASTSVVVDYILDVPATQRSGTYDGDITYQGVTKP